MKFDFLVGLDPHHLAAGIIVIAALALAFLYFMPAPMHRRHNVAFWLAALLVFALTPFAAFAQTASVTASSRVDWGDIAVRVAVPLILAAIGALLRIAVTDANAELKKRTGIALDQAALDRVVSFAQTQAGIFIAKGDANIMNASVDVGSPAVAELANAALRTIPDDLKRAGITPDRVPALIVGEIGKLQSNSSTSPVASKG